MPSLKEALKNWFGYSRRERRATFILLVSAIVIAGVRYALPEDKIEIEIQENGQPVVAAEYVSQNKTAGYDKQPEHKAGIYRAQKQGRTAMRRPVQLIDINNCDSAALERLPGIGPVLSARIIRYRNLLGGYVHTEQLREVYGLSPETYQLISGKVFADSNTVKKIKVNSAGYRELIRLPYWGKYEVNAVLKYREIKGNIKGINEMIDNKLITPDKAEKVRAYLEFGEQKGGM